MKNKKLKLLVVSFGILVFILGVAYINREDIYELFPDVLANKLDAAGNKAETNEVNDDVVEITEEEKIQKKIEQYKEHLNLVINGQPTTINTELKVDVMQLSADGQMEFDFSNVGNEVEYIKINDKETNIDESYAVDVLRISSQDKIKLDVKFKSEENATTYYINTLPSTFPQYIVQGESSYAGEYYVTTGSQSEQTYIYKMNNQGEVTFYKQTAEKAYDFKKHIVGDKVRYSYLEQDSSVEALDQVGYSPTKTIILDESYQIIDEVRLSAHGDIKVGDPTESHDFVFIEDGHYILTSYLGTTVNNIPTELIEDNESNVVNAIIQEVKDGEVLWQWESIDYPELYGISVEGNEYANELLPWADYQHLNSIYIDPKDDNLIVSFRNLDAIIKLDRQNGDILWILGGKGDEFGLTNEQKFSRQHAAQVTEDGSILLYDNGVDVQQSRIIKLKIDEVNKTVLEYEVFQIEGQYYRIMGMAQELDAKNNVFLVTWGGMSENSESNRSFSEIDFSTNEILFNMSFEGNTGVYRVYKFE